jgi:hypothetical protein
MTQSADYTQFSLLFFLPFKALDALKLRKDELARDISVLRDFDVTIDAVIALGDLTHDPFRRRRRLERDPRSIFRDMRIGAFRELHDADAFPLNVVSRLCATNSRPFWATILL